mmetsp:Transcript_81986/g.211266  ORF Transcript_81986/g.211266 Transcript_81986/m.211266 type:complete len:314 (+) Transcript_81986:746-1687(+)
MQQRLGPSSHGFGDLRNARCNPVDRCTRDAVQASVVSASVVGITVLSSHLLDVARFDPAHRPEPGWQLLGPAPIVTVQLAQHRGHRLGTLLAAAASIELADAVDAGAEAQILQNEDAVTRGLILGHVETARHADGELLCEELVDFRLHDVVVGGKCRGPIAFMLGLHLDDGRGGWSAHAVAAGVSDVHPARGAQEALDVRRLHADGLEGDTLRQHAADPQRVLDEGDGDLGQRLRDGAAGVAPADRGRRTTPAVGRRSGRDGGGARLLHAAVLCADAQCPCQAHSFGGHRHRRDRGDGEGQARSEWGQEQRLL